jgi:hypothetical protein
MLLAVQTAGIAIVLWWGVPIYRLIIENPGPQHLDWVAFVWGSAAVALIQVGYWFRLNFVSALHFRPNVILSHLILFLGRLTFVFGATIFSTIVYLRLPQITPSLPRFALLFAVLFSLFCYTPELENLGQSMSAKKQT